MANDESVYRITFINQGKIYEIYAQHVNESELFGFIEVEDFVFRNTSSVVLDPAEERLKSEFSGVKRTFIPIQSVVRIDLVEKEGVPKISEVSGERGNNVSLFPGATYPTKKENRHDEKS